jgi:hypothetical protein
MRHADQPTAQEAIHVGAPPGRIWPLVSDIRFSVGASEELQSVEWITGEGDEPRVGRCFVGTNRNRYYGEWQTTSTVIECDEPRAFAWAVGDVDEPNTTWRYTLQPDDTGTFVTQWMRIGIGDSGLTTSIARIPDKEERIVEGRLHEFRAAMRVNLELIKKLAEGA